MKKPASLIQLIEELHEDGIHSDVETTDSSKAVIYLTDADAKKGDGITLSSSECYVLFANVSTVKRMADAVSSAKASIVLHEVRVRDSVLDALESKFVAVDEEG